MQDTELVSWTLNFEARLQRVEVPGLFSRSECQHHLLLNLWPFGGVRQPPRLPQRPVSSSKHPGLASA